jgi:homogentisate 1,2-dioxygenase
MKQTSTEELAVMMDTFRSLRASDLARSIADEQYAWSWARER